MKIAILSLLACASLGLARESLGTCHTIVVMSGLDKSKKPYKKIVAISSLTFEKKMKGLCDVYDNGIHVKAYRKIKLANDVPFDPTYLNNWISFNEDTRGEAEKRYDNMILDYKSKDYAIYKHNFSYDPWDD